MSLKPFLKQLCSGFTLVAIGIQIMHFARIVFPGGTEPLLAQEANGQLRQRAEIKHGFRRESAQLGGQHLSIVLIRTHYACEMLAIQCTI
ncbi:hypothetical protein D3C76_1302220 [compost metagenome]